MSSPHNHPAFVNTQPTALARKDGVLFDLRLAVKDLFHIQGLPTGAGNPDWLATHPLPTMTNTAVCRLLESGMQYMGKTMTDELAYSLNGQNIHYPALINPITPSRLVGGSSSGSAIAVAENLTDIGLGTDTGGSIRVPASYNGLFGLRTSHGAIATDNMVPLAPSFDTVGWFSQNIHDLERVARVLLIEQLGDQAPDQLSIGVLTNLITEAEHRTYIDEWTSGLSKKHHINEQVFDVQALQTAETFRILQAYEIWQQHGEWFTAHQPHFADDIKARILWCETVTEIQQKHAKEQQNLVCDTLQALFQSNDVLLVPTTPGRSPLLTESADYLRQYREQLMALTAIAGLTGAPQIHLPLFKLDGAPCGLSLIGKPNRDLALITIARNLLSQNDTLQMRHHS